MNKVGSDALNHAETMRVIYNSIIPFRGFVAINLCGVIFARKEYKPLGQSVLKHEAVHTMQMQRDGYVHFYAKYLLEYLRGLVKYKNTYLAYRNVSYEVEAYNN